jgi:DNA helicase II / ATP-dependent DNA helicase PcrA
MALGEVLGGIYPWCAGWEKQLRELFAAYVALKQAQNVLDYDDLLLYWAQTVSDPLLAEEIGAVSITSWSTNIRTPIVSRPRSCWR